MSLQRSEVKWATQKGSSEATGQLRILYASSTTSKSSLNLSNLDAVKFLFSGPFELYFKSQFLSVKLSLFVIVLLFLLVSYLFQLSKDLLSIFSIVVSLCLKSFRSVMWWFLVL